MIETLVLQRLRADPERTAIADDNGSHTRRDLTEAVKRAERLLDLHGVAAGAVVSLEGNTSLRAIAFFLALIRARCIVVLLVADGDPGAAEKIGIAEVEIRVILGTSGDPRFLRTGSRARHPLLVELASDRLPGMILFSSGSAGRPKAILHDMHRFLRLYRIRRRSSVTLSFLGFDHVGGLNTILHTLANGGMLVAVTDRSPDSVCAAIEEHRVQVLPTTPTFLRMACLSGALERHDLGSLRLITYGTEVMPQQQLDLLRAALPQVRLLQTYGLSELGIARTRSEDSGSVRLNIDGDGFETRVVAGELQIRADSAMKGYLNAESRFTDDDWFRTGDAVETQDGYYRFLGRKSERINVGGEKVYPSQVETVLESMPGVLEAVVRGEPNGILGQIVAARIRTVPGESRSAFVRRVRRFCADRLPRFMIPQKVELVEQPMWTKRFKKLRGQPTTTEIDR